MDADKSPQRTVLALDLGGTKINAAFLKISATGAALLAPPLTASTPSQAGATAVLEAAVEVSQRALKSMPDVSVEAIGMSTGGVVAGDHGRISHATDSIRGWAGTNLREPFEAHFGVPFAALNDVQAHGLGEWRHGVGRGHDSLLLVAVGTGIGGCLILNGQLVTGCRGAAGHIGHIDVEEAQSVPCSCGRTGHLEGLASGPGILSIAERLGVEAQDRSTGPALTAAARAGNSLAQRAYEIAGRATGRAVGGLLNVLDVDLVAIAGGVANAYEGWLPALHRGVADSAMTVVASTPVVPAEQGSHAALFGAAHFALTELLDPAFPEGSDNE